MAGQLYVISGPSGVGKSSIVRGVRGRVKGLAYSISHTSRKPREGEVDGVDYHFVERDTFKRMIQEGAFAEWAEVYDAFYGTPLDGLQAQMSQGLDVILDVDGQGAENIKKHFKESILIYVLPPSLETLEERLRRRGTDDDEVIRARFEKALREIKRCLHYDYIVFNENIDKAVEEVTSIILSVRARRSKKLPMVEKIFSVSFSS
jgi:guanylate kinase